MLFNKCLIGSYCRPKNGRFVADPTSGCYLCWSNLPDTSAYEAHMQHHRNGVKVDGFNASWKSIGKLELIECILTVSQSALTLTLKNNSKDVVRISQVAVYNSISSFDLVRPDAFPVSLETDYRFSLEKDLNELSSHNHIVIVYEATSNGSRCEAVQSYSVQKKEPEIEQLEEEMKLLANGTKTPVQPKDNGRLELSELPAYLPSVEVKSLFSVKFKPNPALTGNEVKILEKITKFTGQLTPANYVEMLTLMVQIEDYGAQLSIFRSTKQNRRLLKVKANEYLLQLPHSEGRPLFLLAGDKIWIGKPTSSGRTYGVVQHVTSNEIKMKFPTAKEIVSQEPIHSVHFEVNRLTFKLQRLALDTVKELGVIELLFPQAKRLNDVNESTIPELDIHNKRLKGDVYQLEAVHHIVAGTAHPLPYVLIGFPGTGKTATIVESVYQLWKLDAKNRILVCAQSNAACDEIAERLVALIPTTQQYNVIRLFAASVRKSCNNAALLENSNFEERSIPCLVELYKYRIIVATLTVSGRLLQGRFDAQHFTHLFIDECESATESFTLLPIALCSSTGKINARIVLSGDPNQLGPVVRTDVAKAMGMDVSMFNRLAADPLYQRNKKTKLYDRRITCRLRNNYRSHPSLVRMPNELFYNNEMRSSAAIEKIQWLSELDFLPKKGFPILFEHVEGIPETKENCSSWYNETEAESVLHYINKLLQNEPHTIKQSDIGVIAAYKRQVIHIAETLEEHNYTGIEVGTVEQFQGREKPIIIVSTVRNGSLGFLKQRERINVMLTRAIGLLIIIGHPKTLYKNKDWSRILAYTSTECGGEVVADYGYDVGDYRC